MAYRKISVARLRVGDDVRIWSQSGRILVEARIVAKRRARRHFSRGVAYDLTVERIAPAHRTDMGKRWVVYALGEDRYERISQKTRRYGNTDRATVVESRPSMRATIPARGHGPAAIVYRNGKEIHVFETARGYYVEVPGVAGVPGPFGTIREAAQRGRDIVDDMTQRAASYKRRRARRNHRTGRFTRAR